MQKCCLVALLPPIPEAPIPEQVQVNQEEEAPQDVAVHDPGPGQANLVYDAHSDCSSQTNSSIYDNEFQIKPT